MARPKGPAAVVTAYDAGYQHGRSDAPGGPPEWVNNADLLQAYDQGLSDGSSDADAPAPRPRAATRPRSSSTGRGPASEDRLRAEADAHSTRERRRSSARFSHPMHWGSGARGHVVGRPTLQPPRRLSAADGTGFAFGVVLYALALSWVRYGPAGLSSWLSAKFLNRPLITADQATQLEKKAS